MLQRYVQPVSEQVSVNDADVEFVNSAGPPLSAVSGVSDALDELAVPLELLDVPSDEEAGEADDAGEDDEPADSLDVPDEPAMLDEDAEALVDVAPLVTPEEWVPLVAPDALEPVAAEELSVDEDGASAEELS